MSITVAFMAAALWSIDVDPKKRDLMLSEKRCPVVIERWAKNGYTVTAEQVRRAQSLEEEAKAMDVMGADYATTMFRKAYQWGEIGSLTQTDFFGDLFYRGCATAGLPARKDVAAAYYEGAAVRHYAPSQWKLGRMMFEGDGVTQDTATGVSWLTLAAMEGSMDAAAYLESKGLEVPVRLPKTTFEAMHDQAEDAYKQMSKRYWSGILQDSTKFLANAANIYVQARVQANADIAQQNAAKAAARKATQSASAAPQFKPYIPEPSKIRMITQPTYCYAHDAGSYGVGETLYMRLQIYCH